MKELRGNVGLVFQYPEYQLFESTVLADVMYGALNFGMSKAEAEQAAREALALVNISEEYFEYSPFDLSGGEKRRVAIAGVMSMHISRRFLFSMSRLPAWIRNPNGNYLH